MSATDTERLIRHTFSAFTFVDQEVGDDFAAATAATLATLSGFSDLQEASETAAESIVDAELMLDLGEPYNPDLLSGRDFGSELYRRIVAGEKEPT